MHILFVHNYPTKFVQIDLALLSEKYQVREWYQRTRLVNLPALAAAVRGSDLVFGWFAGPHTFFSSIIANALGRPSVLVVGGYDTASLPQIGYGSMRGGIRRWVARTAMLKASHLVAFSDFSRNEAIRNAGMRDEKVDVVFLGIEDCRATSMTKEEMIVTVGGLDRVNLRRKGLEAFVRAAAGLPELAFVLIGDWRDGSADYLRSIATANVRLTGRLGEPQLQDYLGRARIYVQASLHEGFGLSVAQAMQRESVPVVTRAGALPEVVGEAGVYLESAEPTAVIDGIRQALKLDASWGKRARERVIREFPLARRRQGLYDVIERSSGNYGRAASS